MCNTRAHKHTHTFYSLQVQIFKLSDYFYCSKIIIQLLSLTPEVSALTTCENPSSSKVWLLNKKNVCHQQKHRDLIARHKKKVLQHAHYQQKASGTYSPPSIRKHAGLTTCTPSTKVTRQIKKHPDYPSKEDINYQQRRHFYVIAPRS